MAKKQPDIKKNIVEGQIYAEQSVIVGDNNSIENIFFAEASILEHLEIDLERIENQKRETKNRILAYPEIEEFKIDLHRLEQEQNDKTKRFENAKKALVDSLIKTVKTFSRTDQIEVLENLLNSNELQKAQEYLIEKANLPKAEIDIEAVKRTRIENKNNINKLKNQFDEDSNSLLNICQNLSIEQLSIYQLEIVEDLLFYSEFYFTSIQNKELSVTLSNTAIKLASPFKNNYEAAKEAIQISSKILTRWEKVNIL